MSNNFHAPLMRAGLSLMKNVLIPLAKSDTIRINTSSISNRCSYSKDKFWIRHVYTDNLKGKNERYHENS